MISNDFLAEKEAGPRLGYKSKLIIEAKTLHIWTSEAE